MLKYLKYVFKVKMNYVFFIQAFSVKYISALDWTLACFHFWGILSPVLSQVCKVKRGTLLSSGFQWVHSHCLNVSLILSAFNYFSKFTEYI